MTITANALARPVAAASLILIRQASDGPEVLVGRRRRDLRFMPGVFAFPGGKLDRQDGRPSPFSEILPTLPGNTDWETKRRHAIFLRAALRELHEETGLLLVDLASQSHGADPEGVEGGVWAHYTAAGFTPAFASMKMVARAITPTASPLRFHNRFFLGDGHGAIGEPRDSGELDEISWVAFSEARSLPMAEVGTLAMEEALAHWRSPNRRAAPLFQWVGREMTLRIRRQSLSTRRLTRERRA